MSTPTADEIERFVIGHFRAKSECDREALLQQFAPDVRIWTPLSLTSRNFVERPTVGAERIADIIASEFFYAKVGREWTVEDWVSDGIKLAVRASLRATVAATGEAYENSYTFFYRLEGLRIAESWEAFDTAFATDLVRPQRDATRNDLPPIEESSMTDQLAPADLIRKHFVTKAKGDREELRKEIAPDVRWWAPASAAAKGIVENPMVGADRAIDHLTVEMYEEEGREWTITHLLSEGDLVTVRARLQARVAKNGKDYDNTYLFLYRVTEGRIAEAWVEFDTAYAFDKFA